MGPIFTARCLQRKNSISEVANWWSTLFSVDFKNIANPRTNRREEYSTLLTNSDQEDMAQTDEGEHEAITVHNNISTDDILTYHEQLSTRDKHWRHWLLVPARILFPSKILLNFFLANIIPALSQLIPLFYVGKLPHESSLALAGQFQFVSVVLEVIQEGIGNSLFHFVGKNYKEKRSEALAGLKLAIALLFCAGVILTLITLVFTKEFVRFIDTPQDIVDTTKMFLWVSSFSFPMILLNYALNNFLFITTSGHIVLVQTIQLLSTFLFNYYFFRQGSWSLNWDVDQLGTYKVIQSGFDLLLNLFFVHFIEGIGFKTFWWDNSIRKSFKTKFADLVAVSWPNFGDSAIRNFFYFVVTLKFINSLGSTEVGAWNLLMTVMYGVFLIPTNSISNYVRVVVGHEAEGRSLKKVIRDTSKEALECLTAWTAILCPIGYLLWPEIAFYFNPSNEAVQKMSTTMFNEVGWSFVLLSYNNVLDSLFYGTGKTIYVFYQSVYTNLLCDLGPFLLFVFGIIEPSYWLVTGLWCVGLIVDFFLTGMFCVHLWRQIPN